jgi:hypothetical protein
MTNIIKEWPKMTKWQRNLVCGYQRLTSAQVTALWPKMTEHQRDWVCINQRLTSAQVTALWPKMTEHQRDLVKAMKLPTILEARKRAGEYADRYNLKVSKGFLYAFREHDIRGCGVFKKTTFYKKGVLYRDWHCDPRPEVENSFGFGIWPKGNTPVQVPLRDFVVAVNRDDGKARVMAFKKV